MSDWFKDTFGAAVADIRSELIDRGWFGRNTRPPDHTGPSSEHSPSISFGDWLSGDPSPIGPNPDADNYWHPEPANSPDRPDPDRDPSPDHGIDR